MHHSREVLLPATISCTPKLPLSVIPVDPSDKWFVHPRLQHESQHTCSVHSVSGRIETGRSELSLAVHVQVLFVLLVSILHVVLEREVFTYAKIGKDREREGLSLVTFQI